MPNRIVFDKIQQYISKIDDNSDQIITKNELTKAEKEIPSIWFERIADIVQDNDTSTDKIYMQLGLTHAEEIDESHTPSPESDGGKYRFKCEDEEINYSEALREAKFFIERSVEKWFKYDIDKNGIVSNIEDARWCELNCNPTMIDGDLSASEYAKKNNIKEQFNLPLDYKEWIQDWKQETLYGIAYDYGVELKEEDIKDLENYATIQINRMLVKAGQYETAPLYTRCSSDAYTRLVTNKQTVSCCGGDITPPPESSDKQSCGYIFSSMDSQNSVNTSEEVKKRLAWATFKTPPEEFLNRDENALTIWQDMPDGVYKTYHTAWNQLKKMTAADYRELLKPENEARRKSFETNAAMTVQQIVDYIDIVESTTGIPFDSNDWSINIEQFEEICKKVNGTWGDETILDGKTKADVLPERQELYDYLKKNNLLLDQFL